LGSTASSDLGFFALFEFGVEPFVRFFGVALLVVEEVLVAVVVLEVSVDIERQMIWPVTCTNLNVFKGGTATTECHLLKDCVGRFLRSCLGPCRRRPNAI